jgi:hypothetical protein
MNEMLDEQVPLFRLVHVMWGLLFQADVIRVICCRLPHPFCNTFGVLC